MAVLRSSYNAWSNFYMIEYCEIFKMAFAKILDFQPRLKTRSKAPTRLSAIFGYPIFNFADTLVIDGNNFGYRPEIKNATVK